MARVIANGVVEVAFGPVADINAPTLAEVTGAEDLTPYLNTLDTAASSATVETPNFSTRFVGSIPGTYSATVTGEFYRDDTDDVAWDTLARDVEGVFIIGRFGFGASKEIELWPVRITNRSPVALGTNESQRFSIEAAVPEPPNESEPYPTV